MRVKSLTFYKRGVEGVLYGDARVLLDKNSKKITRLRFSTFLPDTEENRTFLMDIKEDLVLKALYSNTQSLKNWLDTKNNKGTLSELCNLYLQEKTGLKKSSIKYVKRQINNLPKFLYTLSLKDINKKHIMDCYTYFENKKISKETLKIYMNALRNILNIAVELGYIDKSPFFIKKYTHDVKPPREIFTESEIVSIIEKGRGEIGLFLKIALLTGARTGEILALQYKHIDFEKNTVNIEQSIDRHNMGIVPPKTRYSIRKIDLLPTLKHFLEKDFTGKEKPESFIFIKTKSTKKPILSFTHSYLYKDYKKLLSDLNISYKSIYTTRHSFASWMLMRGQNILWISKMLGHKNTNITLANYMHYIPQKEEKNAVFLQDLFKFN